MSEIATLKRMAASDEYSATETAIFDGAVNELARLHRIEAVAQALICDEIKQFSPDRDWLCNECRYGYAKTPALVPHSKHCWVGKLIAVW